MMDRTIWSHPFRVISKPDQKCIAHKKFVCSVPPVLDNTNNAPLTKNLKRTFSDISQESNEQSKKICSPSNQSSNFNSTEKYSNLQILHDVSISKLQSALDIIFSSEDENILTSSSDEKFFNSDFVGTPVSSLSPNSDLTDLDSLLFQTPY